MISKRLDLSDLTSFKFPLSVDPSNFENLKFSKCRVDVLPEIDRTFERVRRVFKLKVSREMHASGSTQSSQRNHGKLASLEIERATIRDNVAWKRFIERLAWQKRGENKRDISSTADSSCFVFEGVILRALYHSLLCRQAAATIPSQLIRGDQPISRRFHGFFMDPYFSDKRVIFLDDRLPVAGKSRREDGTTNSSRRRVICPTFRSSRQFNRSRDKF